MKSNEGKGNVMSEVSVVPQVTKNRNIVKSYLCYVERTFVVIVFCPCDAYFYKQINFHNI